MEKKRKSKTQWLVIAGYLLTGIACGLLIVIYLEHLYQAGAPKQTRLLHLLLLVLCMYAALLIQIVIHEAGHLSTKLFPFET